MKEITLQEMLSAIIGELRENWRWGTAHIYQSTLNVFSKNFNDISKLHLRKLNPVVLKRFEMHRVSLQLEHRFYLYESHSLGLQSSCRFDNVPLYS